MQTVKGLQIPTTTPTRPGGLALSNNFIEIANRIPPCNYTATTDPTPNDDIGDGYAAGSIWHNGNSVFRCVSASSGAAVWRRLTADPVIRGFGVENPSGLEAGLQSGELTIPADAVLTKWRLTSTTSGSISINIKRSTLAGYPSSTTIANAALTASQKGENTVSIALSAGDILTFEITGTPTVSSVTISLFIQP